MVFFIASETASRKIGIRRVSMSIVFHTLLFMNNSINIEAIYEYNPIELLVCVSRETFVKQFFEFQS